MYTYVSLNYPAYSSFRSYSDKFGVFRCILGKSAVVGEETYFFMGELAGAPLDKTHLDVRLCFLKLKLLRSFSHFSVFVLSNDISLSVSSVCLVELWLSSSKFVRLFASICSLVSVFSNISNFWCKISHFLANCSSPETESTPRFSPPTIFPCGIARVVRTTRCFCSSKVTAPSPVF